MKKSSSFALVKRMTAVLLCALFSFGMIVFINYENSIVHAYDDDYEVDIYYGGGFKIQQDWSQDQINEYMNQVYENSHLGMQKCDVIIKNTGKEPLIFSKESFEVNDHASDEEAFILNYTKGVHTVNKGESWKGMQWYPKTGLEPGEYTMDYRLEDETGNIHYVFEFSFSVVGSEPALVADVEKLEWTVNQYTTEIYSEYVEIMNAWNENFDTLEASSDNEKFVIDESDLEWGLYSGRTKRLSAMYIGDLSEVTKTPETGTITITAKNTESNKTASITINCSIVKKIYDDATPYFSSHEEIIDHRAEESEMEDEPWVLYYYYNSNSSDIYDKVAFKLTGEDADKFEVFKEHNNGIRIQTKDKLTSNIYNCTINMYYDPDASEGNVDTTGDPVDTKGFRLSVYSSNDYKFTLVDDEGTPLFDEDNNEVHGKDVPFGFLKEGYSKYEANSLSQTVKVKNVGTKPITFNTEQMKTSGYYKEALEAYEIQLPQEKIVSVQPGELFEMVIKPRLGKTVGSYKRVLNFSPEESYGEVWVNLSFSVGGEGYNVEIDDADYEKDSSGNVVVDLGTGPSDAWKSTEKLLWVHNLGEETATISVEGESEFFEIGFAYRSGLFNDEDNYGYNYTNEYELAPGEDVAVVFEGNIKKLREKEGEYSEVYTIRASSNDSLSPEVVKNAKVIYETSDTKYNVTLDFLGAEGYENIEWSASKNSSLKQVVSRMLPHPEDISYQDEDGKYKRCIGWSTKPDSEYNSWEEYEQQKALDEKALVTEDTTVYIKWAKRIDSYNLKITVPKPECGQEISSSNINLSPRYDNVETNCELASATWYKENDEGDYEEVSGGTFDAENDYKCVITLKPDYGNAFLSSYSGGLIINDDYEYFDSDSYHNLSIDYHVWLYHDHERVARRFATCDTPGYKTHEKCKGCNRKFVDGELVSEEAVIVPATGHDYGDWEKVDENSHKRICENNSTHIDTEDHTWDKGEITTPPTLDQDGVRTYTCTKCDATKEETVPKLDHIHKTEAVAKKDASCTEDGYEAHWKCTQCDSVFNDAEGQHETSLSSLKIPTIAHNMEAHEAKDATCTETGNIEYWSCDICNKKYSDESGSTVADNVVTEALGHQLSHNEGLSATCSRKGIKENWECDRCNKIYLDEEAQTEVSADGLVLEKTNHDLIEQAAVEATCTATGNIKHWKCETCNKLFKDSEGSEKASSNEIRTPKADHSWGNGEVINDSTCTETGTKKYTCSVCEEEKTVIISKKRHVWEDRTIREEPATCEQNGIKVVENRCKNCNELNYTSTSTLTATGHKWDAGTITTPPTCSSGGIKTFTCEHDPTHTKEEPISLDNNEHLWDEGEISTPATCTKEGIKTFKCKYDEHHTKTESIPVDADAHVWDVVEVTVPATYTTEGEQMLKCAECGITKTEPIAPLKYPAGGNPNQKSPDGTSLGAGASAAAAEKAILSSTSEEGPKGSKYAPLQLRSSKQGNTNINLTWNKVSKAKTYVVYGNACGKKNKMKRLASVSGKAFNVKKINAKLKKGTYHKFMVVALDANKNVVTTSKVVHVTTKGNKKFANPTKVKVKKPKNLKKGKSHKLAGKMTGLKGKAHRKIAYESSNPKVATVSGKGVIKAKKKGTCYVYAYAQNGVCQKVKVVVK